MHEFSISSEIVRSVLELIEKKRLKKVRSLDLDIGEMTLINTDQVMFWVQELFKGTKAEGLKINIRKVKAKIHCLGCGFKGGLKIDQNWDWNHRITSSCPRCHSFGIEIEKGRECLLKRVEAER